MKDLIIKALKKGREIIETEPDGEYVVIIHSKEATYYHDNECPIVLNDNCVSWGELLSVSYDDIDLIEMGNWGNKITLFDRNEKDFIMPLAVLEKLNKGI